MLALANVLFLGSESDFGDVAVRALLLDNVDVVNSVLLLTEGSIADVVSGVDVVRRLLSFYS
jgi:hypothetical protein